MTEFFNFSCLNTRWGRRRSGGKAVGGKWLWAEYMGRKHNGHIYRYGTPIFGNIAYVFKLIKYGGGSKIWLESTCQVFFLHPKQDYF